MTNEKPPQRKLVGELISYYLEGDIDEVIEHLYEVKAYYPQRRIFLELKQDSAHSLNIYTDGPK